MKQKKIHKTLDVLTRTFCVEALASRVNDMLKKGGVHGDTLYLIHHHFQENDANSRNHNELLTLCGFLLRENFPYVNLIGRVGDSTFFLYVPGYRNKENIEDDIHKYQALLRTHNVEDTMICLHIGVGHVDMEQTFHELLRTVEVSMQYAKQHHMLYHIGAIVESLHDFIPYPHPIKPYQLSCDRADSEFISCFLHCIYHYDDIHQVIDKLMSMTCSYFQVQHIYVMLKDYKQRYYQISHEQILKKAHITNDNLKKMCTFIGDRYEHVFDEFDMIVCNRIEELKHYDVFMKERQRLRGVCALMQHKVLEHGSYIGYITMLDCEKERIWTETQVSTFHYASQILSLALCLERNQEYIENYVQSDHVTNAWKLSRFKQQVAKDLKNDHNTYALLTLDLKNFKLLNAEYGYPYGNKILIAISKVLRQIMETNESFARMEADNFIALLHYDTNELLHQRLNDIIRRLERLSDIHNTNFQIICIMGVYVIKDNSIPIDTMIDYANSAKKQMKDCHKSSFAFFNDIDEKHKLQEHHYIQDVIFAFQHKEFIVFYQPKINILTKRCYGLEALIRWQHGNKLIPPDEFIPLFEKNGYINELDMYVLKIACIQINTWLHKGVEPLPIAINISREHLKDPDIVPNILRVFQQFDIPHRLIEFEITENALLENLDDVMNKAVALKNAGFRLSMDDFGTGYSSLSILNTLPIDMIKLDREFFQKVMNEREKIIISNVIHMAHQLNIDVVSEGIETPEHIRFLQEIGCKKAQGFYFSRPQPIEQLEPYLWEPFAMEDL